MFNFFKRKKKKDEEAEKKEVIKDTEQDLENNNNNNDASNNDDKSNEEFNKFNEANENNKFNEEINDKAEEVEKVIEVSEEGNEEEKSSKLKSGRFIDLTKTENTEKKTLNIDQEDEKLQKEQIEKKTVLDKEVSSVKESLKDKQDSKTEEAKEEESSNEKESFFDKLKKGLTKTRDNFTSSLTNLFTRNVKIDDDLYDELEEILISADIGMSSTIEIVDELRGEIKKQSIKESDKIYPVLKEIMIKKLDEKNLDNEIKFEKGKLTVILVIGVNGVGKTTTIGKLANNFKNEGKSVMLAAADTFRAAAIEQLQEWSDRADVELITHKEGADPSAVIFDAIKSARSKNIDVLICDTAGRLHNKKNLMQELDKINRTIDTHAVNSNRENLLVLDATTGQNAVSQLKEFKNVTDITGLILTKLDGTAKGGVIFPLQVEVEVPVKYIGVGEGIDHLQKFDLKTFVDAMF